MLVLQHVFGHANGVLLPCGGIFESLIRLRCSQRLIGNGDNLPSRGVQIRSAFIRLEVHPLNNVGKFDGRCHLYSSSTYLQTVDQCYFSSSRASGIIDASYTLTALTGRSAMLQLDKQAQRIANIFGMPEVPGVDTATLERYLTYLKQHLAFPCQLTGIEDFDWEEYYVIGPGSKAEHERLRKTRPSCMDTYDLLSFDDDVDPDSGLLVHVRRVSDKKTFLLPLADLEATKKKTKNYQLLDDYAVWFVNWR